MKEIEIKAEKMRKEIKVIMIAIIGKYFGNIYNIKYARKIQFSV